MSLLVEWIKEELIFYLKKLRHINYCDPKDPPIVKN